jgi:hypothetical protein
MMSEGKWKEVRMEKKSLFCSVRSTPVTVRNSGSQEARAQSTRWNPRSNNNNHRRLLCFAEACAGRRPALVCCPTTHAVLLRRRCRT